MPLPPRLTQPTPRRGAQTSPPASYDPHSLRRLPNIGNNADDVVLNRETAPELQPSLTVLPLQRLSYFVADLKNSDVDQPRNLANSVTVE